MNIKLKNMQPGTKLVVNDEGATLAHVIKLDGEIVIDHIQTAYDDDATLFPKDNDGKPLNTCKIGLTTNLHEALTLTG